MCAECHALKLKKLESLPFKISCLRLPNSSNLRAAQTSVDGLAVLLKRMHSYLRTEWLVASQPSKLSCQTDMRPKLQPSRFARLRVFLFKNTQGSAQGRRNQPLPCHWRLGCPFPRHYTVSSLSSDGVDSDNGSADSYTE